MGTIEPAATPNWRAEGVRVIPGDARDTNTPQAPTVQKVAIMASMALGIVAVAVLTLWLLPSWLTQDPGLPDAPARHKAAADARTGVVAFVAVLGGLGGLYYTSRNFELSRKAQITAQENANEASHRSAEALGLSERGQITDRYSKSVEMLGHDSPEIRIGGIYALGHIMNDSPRYEEAIVAALSAFIRRAARLNDNRTVPWPEKEAERDEVKPSFPIQAALNVLAQPSTYDHVSPDLRDSDLRGARLRSAELRGVNFRRSYLYKAKLSNADLSEAILDGADLTGADLTGANLVRASLVNADLEKAILTNDSLSAEQLRLARNCDRISWTEKR